MKKYPDFVSFELPALVWMALIFTLSSIPGPTLEKIDFPYAHPIAHSLLYGMLYYLCYRALSHHRIGRLNSDLSLVIAFLIVGAYGMSDEYHQSFVPGRSEELRDLLIDLTAAFVVLAGIVIIRRIRRKK